MSVNLYPYELFTVDDCYDIRIDQLTKTVGRLEPWDGIVNVRLVTFWTEGRFRAYTMHPVSGQTFPKMEEWIPSVFKSENFKARQWKSTRLDAILLGRPRILQQTGASKHFKVLLTEGTEYRNVQGSVQAEPFDTRPLGELHPAEFTHLNNDDLALLRKWQNSPLKPPHLWKRFTAISKL